MPEPITILATLTRIANAGILLAALWHYVAAVAAFRLLRGWRPSRRWAALSLLAPLASVSAMAFAHASYFNAIVAATLVLGLLVVALRLGDLPVQGGPTWSRLAGIGMVAFGWFYPHFLENKPWLSYAIAAPMGLLPCPTLAALIGASLLATGFGSESWSLTLSSAGLFYALFGAIRLGVRLDLILAIGSSLLGMGALSSASWGGRSRRQLLVERA
jgi:hypothetical protein